MIYNGEEQTRRNPNEMGSINEIITLIKEYKELISNREDICYFINLNILKDKDKIEQKRILKEKYMQIFRYIVAILNELKKLSEFNTEIIEELISICQDIEKRFTTIYENDLDSYLDDIKEFIASYNSEPAFPYEKYEFRGPTDAELRNSSISVDIIEEDKKYNREDKKTKEAIKLSNEVEKLVNAVNKIIDQFYRNYGISEEQTQQEVISTTELMPVNQKSWLRTIWDRIINTINTIKDRLSNNRKLEANSLLSDDGNVVAESPYQEVDEKKKKFKNSLQFKRIIEPISLENINKLGEEICKVIDDEEIIYIIEQELKKILDEEKYENIFHGEIREKSFIVLIDFYADWPLLGDVIILMDNECFVIDMRENTIIYKDIFFESEEELWNMIGIQYDKDSKRYDVKYYRDYKTIPNSECYEFGQIDYKNRVKAFIKTIDGRQYSFWYNADDEFLKGKLPLEILYISKEYNESRNYKKKEDSEKYNGVRESGTWQQLDYEYSYDDAMKYIGMHNSSDTNAIVEYFPNLFVKAVKDGFGVIPKEVLYILGEIHPDIEEAISKSNKEEQTELTELDAEEKTD